MESFRGKFHRKFQVMDAVTLSNIVGDGLAPYSPKEIARDIGCTPRAAVNWKERQNAPNAAQLIKLMKRYAAVREAVLKFVEPPSDDDLNARQIALEERLARLEKLSESNP